MSWKSGGLRWCLVGILAVTLITGCSGNKPKPDQVFLMPAPDVYDEDGGVDPFVGRDYIEDNETPGILYATDRQPATEKDKKQRYYSDRRAYAVRLGLANIQLGDDDSITWEEARRITLLKNRTTNYPLQVTSVEDFGALERSISPFDSKTPRSPEAGDRFAEELNKRLKRTELKDVFIYVHGYKVNFENPVLVASELWHFLGYNGVMIAYAWPATFNFTAYFSDIEDATQSSRNLRSLLLHISQNTDAERIHLIGYSTGTRLVSRTVADLGMYAYGLDPEVVDEALNIGNVLLVGSDMDRAILAGYLIDGTMDVVDSFTIYQSAADKTLNMSKFVFGKERSGQKIDRERDEAAIEYLREHPAIRIIDISHAADIKQNNGHSYFRSSPWVSSDVLMTLRYNLDPASRGLVLDADGVSWEFPPDYIERLREALKISLEGYAETVSP
ncbi:MAG: alpha/beta hydrolase [Woeseiaceae bacterium]|nr:alpha/beta hydrolase [Woeseiaceae bacterium]